MDLTRCCILRAVLKRFAYYWPLIVSFFLIVPAVGLLVYFPGQQSAIAFVLGTGIGKPWLQSQIDACEERAIRKETFTETERRFLKDLYTCLYKGARLTFVLPEASKMMEHYLSGTGEPLRVDDSLFRRNKKVDPIREQLISQIVGSTRPMKRYASQQFYMADSDNPDSGFGLYYGRLLATPFGGDNGADVQAIAWRAEVPWTWPSYDQLNNKYGSPHAESFPIPNMMSLIRGRSASIFIDNGLGEYLTQLGLAKSFLVHAEWTEQMRQSSYPELEVATDVVGFNKLRANFNEPELLQYFPQDIPADATNVRIAHLPLFLQGGSYLTLSMDLPLHRIDMLQAQLFKKAIKAPARVGPSVFSLPEGFKAFVLTEHDDAEQQYAWNHGRTAGAAINRSSCEVIYWAEIW